MCPPHPPWQEGRILYTGIAAGGGGDGPNLPFLSTQIRIRIIGLWPCPRLFNYL